MYDTISKIVMMECKKLDECDFIRKNEVEEMTVDCDDNESLSVLDARSKDCTCGEKTSNERGTLEILSSEKYVKTEHNSLLLIQHTISHQDELNIIKRESSPTYKTEIESTMFNDEPISDNNSEMCCNTFKTSGEVQCPDDVQKFFMPDLVLRRIDESSKSEKPCCHQCRVCPKIFHLTSAVVRHQRIHTDSLPYALGIRDRKFMLLTESYSNRKYNSPVNNLSVMSNNSPNSPRLEYFDSKWKDSMPDLILSRIDDSCTTLKPCCHQCRVCPKIFQCTSAVARHERTHTARRPHTGYKLEPCSDGEGRVLEECIINCHCVNKFNNSSIFNQKVYQNLQTATLPIIVIEPQTIAQKKVSVPEYEAHRIVCAPQIVAQQHTVSALQAAAQHTVSALEPDVYSLVHAAQDVLHYMSSAPQAAAHQTASASKSIAHLTVSQSGSQQIVNKSSSSLLGTLLMNSNISQSVVDCTTSVQPVDIERHSMLESQVEHQHLKRSIRGSSKRVCSICLQEFETKVEYKEHQKLHRYESNKKCVICQATFNTEFVLRKHYMSEHRDISSRLLTCTFCPFTTKYVQSFVIHLRFHTGEKPYACPQCQNLFICRPKLVEHVKSAHQCYRHYKCPYCSDSFEQLKAFRLHRQMHADEFPYTCARCDIRCSRKLDLHVHIRCTHDNERRAVLPRTVCSDAAVNELKDSVSCNHCDKRFDTTETLARHMMMRVKEVHCSSVNCSKSLKNFEELTKHRSEKDEVKLHSDDIDTVNVYSRFSNINRSNEVTAFHDDSSFKKLQTDDSYQSVCHQSCNVNERPSVGHYADDLPKTVALPGNTVVLPQIATELNVMEPQVIVQPKEVMAQSSGRRNLIEYSTFDQEIDILPESVARINDILLEIMAEPIVITPDIVTLHGTDNYPEEVTPQIVTLHGTDNYPERVTQHYASNLLHDTFGVCHVRKQALEAVTQSTPISTTPVTDFSTSEHQAVLQPNNSGHPDLLQQTAFPSQVFSQRNTSTARRSAVTQTTCTSCDDAQRTFVESPAVHKRVKGSVHDPLSYVCSVCLQQFETHEKYTEHQKRHRYESSEKCVICRETYNTQILLQKHYRFEHRDKSSQLFTCTFCPYTTICVRSYVNHIRLHTGEKPYVCSKCRKRFLSRKRLVEHVKSAHQSFNYYQCPHCSDSFKKLKAFRLHRQAHTSKRQYTCKKCDKRYYIYGRFRTHMIRFHKKHHTVNVGLQAAKSHAVAALQQVICSDAETSLHLDDGSVSCNHCEERFDTKAILARHIDEVHSAAKLIKCSKRLQNSVDIIVKHTSVEDDVTVSLDDVNSVNECSAFSIDRNNKETRDQSRSNPQTDDNSFSLQTTIHYSLSVSASHGVPHHTSTTLKLVSQLSASAYQDTTLCTDSEQQGAVLSKATSSQNTCATIRLAVLPTTTASKSVRHHPVWFVPTISQCAPSASLTASRQAVCSQDVPCQTDSAAQAVSQRTASASQPVMIQHTMCSPQCVSQQAIARDPEAAALRTSPKPLVAAQNSVHVHQAVDQHFVPFVLPPLAYARSSSSQRLAGRTEMMDRQKLDQVEPSLKCSVCREANLTELLLRQHCRSRHFDDSNRSNLYNFCPDTTEDVRSFVNHLRLHSGEKPYVCTQCGEQFMSEHNLSAHIKSAHQGEKNYKCLQCSEKFTELSALRLHLQTHEDDGRRYACALCDKRYVFLINLDRHIRRIHSRISKNILCSKCGKVFKSNEMLNIHNIFKHGSEQMNLGINAAVTQPDTSASPAITQQSISSLMSPAITSCTTPTLLAAAQQSDSFIRSDLSQQTFANRLEVTTPQTASAILTTAQQTVSISQAASHTADLDMLQKVECA